MRNGGIVLVLVAFGVMSVPVVFWFIRLFMDARRLRGRIRERMAAMTPEERAAYMRTIDEISTNAAERFANRMMWGGGR